MIEEIDFIQFANFIGDSGSPSYDPDAQALFDRFTTPPTDDRKQIINDFFLATELIRPKLNFLHMMAAADAQAARRNWLADEFNLTAVSSPSFQIDRGYTGDGASSYLNTGFNPTVVGQKYSQNSASAGIYNRTSAALSSVSMADLGTSSGGLLRISPRATGDLVVARINRAANANTPSIDGVGFFQLSRLDAVSYKIFKNGQLASNIGGSTSTGVPNDVVTYLREATLFSNHQLSAGYVGSGLTDGEVSSLNEAVINYLQAVGAA